MASEESLSWSADRAKLAQQLVAANNATRLRPQGRDMWRAADFIKTPWQPRGSVETATPAMTTAEIRASARAAGLED
jgi:hypothetical protein